ncbi:IMP dehydrogenase [Nocardioides sp. GY 10113]|uniref:zinc-dependent alcohol dehydrogenase family protein n=1 Tax=Nocardioides sp. GY 10113 TaxID=2569761 RepID=UPI0010A7FE4B|nr:zinc-dependent alcohol dehydrogenase family protein [Nocardioides sp. GY 10113]TIC87657.1 IMP dehydrogenase [Nocardioides sp. GY 10113]
MLATTIHGTRDIRFEQVPDPVIKKPTDAIVRVTAGCICGSDLWPYRGENPIRPGSTIGHECIGVVEEVGSEVSRTKVGDYVVVPFDHCDNTCPHCLAGMHSACSNLGFTGSGQGQYTRVTQADGSLVAVPEAPSADLVPALLALSDVMPTGWHAAVAAGVTPGSTAVVVGDGAVGLCGVLAAATMGAERIIAMSRHEPRQEVARAFGATHVVAERGEAAREAVLEITDGVGADAALECVGTDGAMKTAIDATRPGGGVGFVGAPHGVEVPIRTLFERNIGLRGGMAPVRAYLPDLLDRVLAGTLDPGAVFDLTLPMSEAAEGYRAMDERRAIKVLLEP